MRIVLIILPCWSVNTPPLGISYIAAALRKAGYDVTVFDLNTRLWNEFKADEDDLWESRNHTKWEFHDDFIGYVLPHIKHRLDYHIKRIIDGDFDIVGFSVFITSLNTTKYFIEEIKKEKPETKIIFGGPGVDIYEIKNSLKKGFVDAAIVGEGEEAIVGLLSRWKTGDDILGIPGIIAKSKTGRFVFSQGALIEILDNLPPPDFSDYRDLTYSDKRLPIMMSRGCIGSCSFCSEVKYWKKFRRRSAFHIYEEIETDVKKYGISKFIFADSLINGDHKILEELVDLILENGLEITWLGNARIDGRLTKNLLQKMAAAGCACLMYGLESGSPKILKLMKKGIRLEEARRVIRDTCNAGIEVQINMIVGFPGETEEDFCSSLDFLFKNQVFINVVNTGVPLGIGPNMELYEHPEKYGIMTNKYGKVFYDENDSWMTIDKKNTYPVRYKRLLRMREFLAYNHIDYNPR